MLPHNSNGRGFVFTEQLGFSEPGTLLSVSNGLILPLMLSVTYLQVFRSRAVPVSLSARFDLLAFAGTGVVFGVT